MGMTAFEIFGVLKLDKKEFDQGLDSAKSIAGNLGSGLASAMKAGIDAISTATKAVVGFSEESVKVGMGFDASMSKVSALAGATGADFDALRDKAKDLGASTQFSATEVADAMGYMGMAGWKTKDMLDGIKGVLDLAAASGEDLATTSDIVTDALTAFGLEAGDAGHFADVLAAASTNANTNVGMMGETFKYFAPIAGTLGYSAEDAAVAIGLMANSGIKASQAGTTLRGAFSRLVEPSSTVTKALEQLGLVTENGNMLLQKEDGTMRSLGEVMDIMRSTIGELDTAEKARIATMLFGQEAQSGMLAIVNASENDYNNLRAAIDNCESSAADMATTVNDNLSGAIKGWDSAIESLHIAVSDRLAPALTDFVKFGTDAVRDFVKAFDEGDISGAMNSIGNHIAQGATAIAQRIPEFITAAINIIGGFVQGIRDNLPQILEAGAKILESLIQGIKENFPEIVGVRIELIQTIVQGLIEMLPEIIDFGMQLVLTLANAIIGALPALIPAIFEIIFTITGSLADHADELIDTAIRLIEALGEGLIAALPVIAEKAPEIIVKLVVSLLEHIPDLIDVGIRLIVGLVEGLIQAIPELLKGVGKIFDAFIKAIKGLFGIHSPSTVMMEIGNNLIQGLLDGIKTTWETLVTYFEEAFAALTLMFEEAWNFIHDTIKKVLETITKTIQDSFDAIKKKIDDALTNIKNAISNIISSMKSVVDNALNGLKNIVSKTFEAVRTTITNILNGVRDFVTNVFNTIRTNVENAVKSVFTAVKSTFEGIVTTITGTLNSVITGVVQFTQNLISKGVEAAAGFVRTLTQGVADLPVRFMETGRDIVNGIWEGISNGWSWLADTVANLARNLLDAAKSALGISSPSKEFAWIGRMSMEGMAEGINRYARLVENAIEDVLDLSDYEALSGDFTVAGGDPVEIDGELNGKNGMEYTQNVYISSPKALTPYEVARQTRNATRDMVLAFSV